jgi:N-acetylglucosamine kinase-like BadF-type ATPase
MGAAGAAHPEIAAIVRRILVEILLSPLEVVGDMEIALEAAFGTQPGIIVIAGTGSIAYGRDREGRIARAGGWGFAISDEGSAHWIGRTAISAVLREKDEHGTPRDGGEKSSKLDAVLLKAWNVNSLNELAAAANSTPPPDFATVLPAVLDAADAGDGLATQTLTLAGSELARLAGVTIRRLFPESTPAVPVAMAGGVFRHSAMVREVFYNEVRRTQPRAAVAPQVVDPVEGALRRARREF